ncbi:FAD-dependent oxidoreductase [Leptolyngbya sp. 'hensonii']|uniref:NAD(P)/FAD-dependent oxidoreductase n=1 Tax=Leptolyngbya sp. 'hensonii' TaxID=1922337 RepID=UPI00094FED2A|nr:FAD-dependent oxidoreductase [Leptolyngbya sp. 'hensonii']OLP20400.1 FAD-dependent oxidoreductase [Leptolyngbya sp. 'hensonii']
MTHIVVIGCGVVGATIAYELSRNPDLSITVLDRHSPGLGSTGAALGVMVGILSQKVKGKAWAMRSASMRRYETLIPELEALTGQTIPYNRQGILKLCFAGDDLTAWKNLVEMRQTQGWRLELLEMARLQAEYPQLENDRLIGAVYSPHDRQLDPTALTLALVAAAAANGVLFRFDCTVQDFSAETGSVQQVQTDGETFLADWVVIAAGLGSFALTQALHQPVEVRPVLGQAVQIQFDHPLGDPDRQPAITGEDAHIVPVGGGAYWVGATVEFSANGSAPIAAAAALEEVLQRATAFCPGLARGTIVKTWSGLRPRPEGRPAPIVGALPTYKNVLLATGHYRNGILLAPATADYICQTILQQ